MGDTSEDCMSCTKDQLYGTHAWVCEPSIKAYSV